jgi:hypothetical protein
VRFQRQILQRDARRTADCLGDSKRERGHLSKYGGLRFPMRNPLPATLLQRGRLPQLRSVARRSWHEGIQENLISINGLPSQKRKSS